MILDQKKCEKGCEYAAELNFFFMGNDKCEQKKIDFFIIIFFFCQIIYKDVFLTYKNLFLIKEYSFHCIKDLLKKKNKKMETAGYVEKVIEVFSLEETIRKFIKIALFNHEMFVEMDKCDNTCSALECLIEASVHFELLTGNVNEKISFFHNHARKYYRQFMFMYHFLIDLAKKI